MRPLAPIVDRMRELARDEIPAPRSCRVQLWDDGTFDALVYHSSGDETLLIRYVRTTSEIVRERKVGADWDVTEFTGGETVREPAYDEHDVRVLATVEPPYE